MKKILSVLIVIACSGVLYSQSNHADCDKALHLERNTIIVEDIGGPGDNLEISGHELGNKKYFTEEHNTVWIRWEAPSDGQLTFDIVPQNEEDDWDFVLFKAEEGQCAEIKSGQIQPIRSNLARNDLSTKGMTGLIFDATDDFVAAGVNPNYSRVLEVNESEHFILAVDINEYEQRGFVLTFHHKPFIPEASEEFPEVEDDGGFGFVDMTEEPKNENNIEIAFQVLLESTKEPINCHAEIVGAKWRDSSLVFEGQSEFVASIPKDEWFYINVKKDGYTFSTEKFKADESMAGSLKQVFISEIKAGEHIVLKEIVFRENTTHLLPTSINALEQLINFMNDYPNAEIEIQGHVNAPGMENEGKVKKFSQKRADQVKEYLVDAGVEGGRIKTKGMGNEFMIYPSPKNYDQEKANRRVEIEILKY